MSRRERRAVTGGSGANASREQPTSRAERSRTAAGPRGRPLIAHKTVRLTGGQGLRVAVHLPERPVAVSGFDLRARLFPGRTESGRHTVDGRLHGSPHIRTAGQQPDARDHQNGPARTRSQCSHRRHPHPRYKAPSRFHRRSVEETSKSLKGVAKRVRDAPLYWLTQGVFRQWSVRSTSPIVSAMKSICPFSTISGGERAMMSPVVRTSRPFS